MTQKHVLIIGGSVSGLGAALALTRDGHRVTVLEADATPLPSSALEAFEKWDRRGSPQTRHSHAFLGRLHNLVRDFAPDLLVKLHAAGAETLTFREVLSRDMPDAQLEPGDEDINMLACRRITFEYVLRRHILDSGLADFRDGVSVEELVADPGDPPVVRGVVAVRASGARETIAADWIVDATGRRTRLAAWVEAIGARKLRAETSPCGIFYSSRFYRLREGQETPNNRGFQGGDLGYLKYGIFPGDSHVFSVTIAASPDDTPLRSVLKNTAAFDAVVNAIPGCVEWVDPERATPVTPVHGMGNLKNTRRFWVEDGLPLALRLFPLGDALIHSNPMYGRGCTLGWVSAFAFADALREHADDPLAAALALEAAIDAEIVPWHEMALRQDADAIEVARAELAGEDPFAEKNPDGSVNPKAFMRSVVREGLLPAMRDDPVVLRAFMRLGNLLDSPTDLMSQPEMMGRVLKYYEGRHDRAPLVEGPSRSELLEVIAAAGASS